ncbi:hypothetical protein CRI70_21065 [Streptomyces sp. Ru87]|nr:hypothetical protein CRI70_21065 [Streptomyces sp. Ru87]
MPRTLRLPVTGSASRQSTPSSSCTSTSTSTTGSGSGSGYGSGSGWNSTRPYDSPSARAYGAGFGNTVGRAADR